MRAMCVTSELNRCAIQSPRIPPASRVAEIVSDGNAVLVHPDPASRFSAASKLMLLPKVLLSASPK